MNIERATDAYSIPGGEAKLTKARKPTLPSCVYYRQENGYKPLVGDFAKAQYTLRPHLVARSIKSQMGKPLAEGLFQEIPDKTPAQISARILQHLLENASKLNRCEIHDAVITVPANFDSAMCAATLDAARMAGIAVTAPDGTTRPILLSEPNAVIYDLVNQIKNGNIAETVIDLSEKKRVLVFDLGGGTLDITMHEIQRRDGLDDVLKVDEIATNRYTLLGGDDFDEAIAQVMFQRYLKQYSRSAEVVSRLRRDEKIILAHLKVMAEDLKLQISENHSDDDSGDGWNGWDDGPSGFPVGGNIAGTGYAYDDTFTAEEVEGILKGFMAENLGYQDYKRLEQIAATRNIIYPILDVLKKTAAKTGEENVHVDAVIVNGGMSRFYMVLDRLKTFFGFDPIVAMDPDLSVARGAAVYHYYLRHNEQMQDDMRKAELSDAPSAEISAEAHSPRPIAAVRTVGIEWGNAILNDGLYLGLRNGAVQAIIPTGAELPYSSEMMTGFSIAAKQQMIQIPIKSRNLDGSYRTIASGNIGLRKVYEEGAYLTFRIHMALNKVLTMKAWICSDVEGQKPLEEGTCTISIDNQEYSARGIQMMAPSGTKLNPEYELNNILQLCKTIEQRQRRGGPIKDLSTRIRESMKTIRNAGNKEDFAELILAALKKSTCLEVQSRYLVLARQIGECWSPAQKKALADCCMEFIRPQIEFDWTTRNVNLVINAIYTLGMCGTKQQVLQLKPLHTKRQYYQACLFTHARTRTDADWLKNEFIRDARDAQVKAANKLAPTAYAIGVLLKKGTGAENVLSIQDEEQIVSVLCEAIMSGKLTKDTITPAIIALGCVADQRYDYAISKLWADRALNCVQTVHYYYEDAIVDKLNRSRAIAEKLIRGEALTQEEEQYLITKLESSNE